MHSFSEQILDMDNAMTVLLMDAVPARCLSTLQGQRVAVLLELRQRGHMLVHVSAARLAAAMSSSHCVIWDQVMWSNQMGPL